MEDGVHYLEDGHFWVEVPGLDDQEEEEELDPACPVHEPTRVTFSSHPIKVSNNNLIKPFTITLQL